MTKKRYLLTISYDGTNYSGWQTQPKKKTIQSLIENALLILLKEKIKISGSGRTDANVHALDQKAHFDTTNEINESKTLRSLNGILPRDIRILSIKAVSPTFHARYSVKNKTYRYYLAYGDYKNPFDRKYCSYSPFKLDISLIEKAANKFIGEHNFLSFANKNDTGAALTKPIKKIENIHIEKLQPNKIYIEITADGFLYKMVRNIVGTLLEIGSNRLKIEDIENIINSKDREKAGPAACPKGLFLHKVRY